jgi:hypothetical protein
MNRLSSILIGAAVVVTANLAPDRSSAQGQQQDDEGLRSVVLANTAVATALACGAQPADGKRAAASIGARLKQQRPDIAGRVTPGYIEAQIFEMVDEVRPTVLREKGRYFGKPCSYWRQMLDAIVADPEFMDFAPTSSSSTGKAPEKSAKEVEAEGALSSPKAMRKQLDSIAANLMKGQLRGYAGCWSSQLEGWTASLCLTNAADNVELVLTSRTGAKCELRDGQARKRSDGIFVYAFSTSGKCSDGRVIEHFEGFCLDKGRTLKCLISVFRHLNEFFLDDDGDTNSGLNGEIVFVRSRG